MLPTYSTGTVAVTAGGTTVTGTGGLWSGINAKQGDFISINNLAAVLITEVTDSTHLKIPPWQGSTLSGVPYVIYQNYVGRVVGVAAAEDVADMLEHLKGQAPLYNVPPGDTAPDPSYGSDGQYAYQITTNKWWIKTAGVWTITGSPVAGYGGTSTSSVTIGTGAKSFTTQPGLAYAGGRVRANVHNDPTKFVEGPAVYNNSTGAMTITVDTTGGSGTFTSWDFTVGSSTLKEIISVIDYGAVGNGTTDDTAAIQAAITAFQGTGARLFFPRGTYKVSSTLTITGALVISGESRAGSTIIWTSTTLNVFSVNTVVQVKFESLSFSGPLSATAGNIITLDGGAPSGNVLSIIRDCTFVQGYNHIVTNSACDWTIDNCFFQDYVNYGLYVSNVLHTDAGDSVVTGGSTFSSSKPNAIGIEQVGSGGLKIVGNKFIRGAYAYRLDLASTAANTVNLIITGNSIEAHSSAAISLNRPSGTNLFGGIVISGNQISGDPGNATVSWAGIICDSNSGWLSRLSIVGNHILMPASTASGLTFTGILLNAAANGFVISGNQICAEPAASSTSNGISIASGAANGVIGPNNFSAILGGTLTNKIVNSSASTYVTNHAVQSGSVSVTCSAADGATWAGSAVITFPVAYDAAPRVICTPGSIPSGIAAFPVSITKTGFTLLCHAGSNGASGTATWESAGVL